MVAEAADLSPGTVPGADVSVLPATAVPQPTSRFSGGLTRPGIGCAVVAWSVGVSTSAAASSRTSAQPRRTDRYAWMNGRRTPAMSPPATLI